MNQSERYLIGWCLLLAGSIGLGLGWSRAQSVDPDFAPVITRSGCLIDAVAVRSDGKFMIAGDFCAVDGHAGWGVARLNRDGSVDKSFKSEFAPYPSPSSSSAQRGYAFSSMAVEADGSVVFSMPELGPFGSGGLARLDSTGRRDKSFAPKISTVSYIFVEPDGKLLIAGNFTTINGLPLHGVARLNRDGKVDPSLIVPEGARIPRHPILAIQPDGRILVGGSAEDDAPPVVRLMPGGEIDRSFSVTNTGFMVNQVFSLAQQDDGRIIVAGNFNSLNGQALGDIVRLNVDGSTDSSFQSIRELAGFDSVISTVLTRPDGKVLIAGSIEALDRQRTPRLARLNHDGTLDTSFRPDSRSFGNLTSSPYVSRLLALPDDQLLLFGRFTFFGNNPVASMARLTSSGDLDRSFPAQPEGPAKIASGVLQPDGKILVLGDFDYVNGQPRPRVARLNQDGSLDAVFSAPPLTRDDLLSIALQKDGKVLVAGGVSPLFRGQSWKGVARLLPDGRLDQSFSFTNHLIARGAFAHVNQVSALPDGRILMGGSFIGGDGVPLAGLMRVDSDGSFDLGLSAHRSNLLEVFNFVASQDGKLVATIRMETDGMSLLGVARFNSDGSFDTSFGTSPRIPGMTELEGYSRFEPDIPKLWLQPLADGKFLVSGGRRSSLVRLLANGKVDSELNTSPLDNTRRVVRTMAVQPDGRVLVGGNLDNHHDFDTAIWRFGLDGKLDVSSIPRSPATLVNIILIEDDGRVIVGGDFQELGAIPRFSLARLDIKLKPKLSLEGPTGTAWPRLIVDGETNRAYRIEVSNDLVNWLRGFSFRLTNSPQFEAPGPAANPAEFYRVRSE